MASGRPSSITLLSIHESITDLVGKPPGTAIELVEHGDRPHTVLILLSCPQCGNPLTIGDKMSNFNFRIKMFKVPRRVTVSGKIDHTCGASFSISENNLSWYN